MKEFHLSPAEVRGFALDEAVTDSHIEALESLGVSFAPGALDALADFAISCDAMDAAPAGQTTASTANALQFLQHFYSQPIFVVTQARVADRLMGRTVSGTWYDEEVVQPIVELAGQAKPYTDAQNVPLASWNVNWDARQVFRMELGVEANRLEMGRSARMRLDSIGLKRQAVAQAMAIGVNDIAFNGFAGLGKTYGLLNDPNLNAYQSAATGAGNSTTWSSKTFLEVVADIRYAVQLLVTQSGGNFNPATDKFTIGVALAASEALNLTGEFGYSVMDWLKKNYSGVTVEYVPQFSGANGGANVFYLIADRIGGQEVVRQAVPAEFFLVGTQQTAKGMIEDYSNATAGAFVLQPIGVVRVSGI